MKGRGAVDPYISFFFILHYSILHYPLFSIIFFISYTISIYTYYVISFLLSFLGVAPTKWKWPHQIIYSTILSIAQVHSQPRLFDRAPYANSAFWPQHPFRREQWNIARGGSAHRQWRESWHSDSVRVPEDMRLRHMAISVLFKKTKKTK